MVSCQRAGIGYRYFQRRNECWSDSSRAVRAVDRSPSWLALDFCHHRFARFRLVGIVAVALSKTSGPSALFQGRARVHPGGETAACGDACLVKSLSLPATPPLCTFTIPTPP